jgi:type VI protein secretion system component Hcp
MSDESHGASRRDLLKGSAIGVGALVGAMALTNAEEVSADAATGDPHTYYLTLSNITGNSRIKLTSLSFGGENEGGTLVPEDVTFTMPTGAFSPLILAAFASETRHKVIIRGYQSDASGKQVNSLIITCTNAEVLHYHLSVSSSGAPTDNVHVSFDSIELKWVLNNTVATWTVSP